MIKEMMQRLQRGERNPNRWANFGGVAFQWKEKAQCQRMIDLMVSYIAQLEDSNKQLIEKNNELMASLPKEEPKTETPAA